MLGLLIMCLFLNVIKLKRIFEIFVVENIMVDFKMVYIEYGVEIKNNLFRREI